MSEEGGERNSLFCLTVGTVGESTSPVLLCFSIFVWCFVRSSTLNNVCRRIESYRLYVGSIQCKFSALPGQTLLFCSYCFIALNI